MVTSTDSVIQSINLPDSNINPGRDESGANVFATETMPPNENAIPSTVTQDMLPRPTMSIVENDEHPMKISLSNPLLSTEAPDVTMIVVVNGVACACVRIYSPVCGTDNKSYFNPCFLACEHGNDKPNVTVQYDGNCIPW